jgi:hypothetical protein
MNCPYCGSELPRNRVCDRCGAVHAPVAPTGWRPDPTARYEGRYYTAGRPTNRVRNGRRQFNDPSGGRMLPSFVEVPAARSSIRLTWLATGATTVIVVLAAAVAWALVPRGRDAPPPPEIGYLSALRDAGLTAQFNSDAAAVAHARQVCRQMEDGGPQQGLPADKFAVDAFCPKFSEGFHILETATVPGTFVLTDGLGIDAITTDGSACQGADGYRDVDAETAVTVKNGAGKTLATTVLGPGKGDSASCTFTFSFPVTEGEDRYVVSVGHRGEFDYSFEQLRTRGVHIHLGH